MTYVELHCHSAYSFLDGASQPEELAVRAAELGYERIDQVVGIPGGVQSNEVIGGQALQDFHFEGPLLHSGDELSGNLEVDVGLQKGDADLPKGRIDIFFREPASATQLLENTVELV